MPAPDHRLTTEEMARFVADGFLRFDELIPDPINQRIIEELRSLESNKIKQIVLLLKGAIVAEGKVGLKMNARKKDVSRIVKKLPALQTPTISQLFNKEWVDIDTVIDEEDVKRLIPALKAAGAQGIIEYPLNKVID